MEQQRNIILYILQLVALKNAVALGWEIKQTKYNEYVFSKNLKDIKYLDLHGFLDSIVPDTNNIMGLI